MLFVCLAGGDGGCDYGSFCDGGWWLVVIEEWMRLSGWRLSFCGSLGDVLAGCGLTGVMFCLVLPCRFMPYPSCSPCTTEASIKS